MVPRTWTHEYADTFQLEDAHTKNTYCITTIHPACLRNVVLQPLTASASASDATHLVHWLSESKFIVHIGSNIWVPSLDSAASPGSRGPQFKVHMMEPATSGYVEKSTTRVVMVQHASYERDSVHTNGITSNSSDEDEESLYDIDERFLSNMVDSRVDSDVQVRCNKF